MSRGTRQRSVRVEDELWDEAKDAAENRGHNLSDIIRDRLTSYVEGTAPTASVKAALFAAWEAGRQAGWDDIQLEYSTERNPYE